MSKEDAVLVISKDGRIRTWIPDDQSEDAMVTGYGFLVAQIAIALKRKPDEFLDFLEKIWEEVEEIYNASCGQDQDPDSEGDSDSSGC